MKKTLSISEAREAMTRLPEYLSKDPRAVEVTRHGRPVMAILPWDHYEGLMETLEVLADEELTASLRRGLRDIQEGRVYTLSKVRRELGL